MKQSMQALPSSPVNSYPDPTSQLPVSRPVAEECFPLPLLCPGNSGDHASQAYSHSATMPLVCSLQEFCLFAVVGLVSDFFLQMLFFTTVLSIDIRRMEVRVAESALPSVWLALFRRPLNDRVWPQAEAALSCRQPLNNLGPDLCALNS